MIAKERLYLNSDRSRVVKEGDPAAAFLLACKGSEVPERFAVLIKNEQEPVKTEMEKSPVEVQTKESSVPKLRRR